MDVISEITAEARAPQVVGPFPRSSVWLSDGSRISPSSGCRPRAVMRIPRPSLRMKRRGRKVIFSNSNSKNKKKEVVSGLELADESGYEAI